MSIRDKLKRFNSRLLLILGVGHSVFGLVAPAFGHTQPAILHLVTGMFFVQLWRITTDKSEDAIPDLIEAFLDYEKAQAEVAEHKRKEEMTAILSTLERLIGGEAFKKGYIAGLRIKEGDN